MSYNFDTTYGRNLREYAEQKFTREGVEARPNSHITAVGPDWIELDGKTKGECARGVDFADGRAVWSACVVDGSLA